MFQALICGIAVIVCGVMFAGFYLQNIFANK